MSQHKTYIPKREISGEFFAEAITCFQLHIILHITYVHLCYTKLGRFVLRRRQLMLVVRPVCNVKALELLTKILRRTCDLSFITEFVAMLLYQIPGFK